jgi:hypothetical protein
VIFIPERGLGGRHEVELFDFNGFNTAGTVGLHSEAIDSPITCNDSTYAGTYACTDSCGDRRDTR